MEFINNFLNLIIRRNRSEQPAFYINGKCWSYSEFNAIIEQVYSLLNNVQDPIVALYATDDIRTYASIIALWLQGKAYVPLNPNQPKERHSESILSVDTHFVLSSDNTYMSGLDGVVVVDTSGINYDYSKERINPTVLEVSDSSLAYILFTSGSTGKPKGVPITRGDVAAFIDSMNHIGLDITPEDKCLQPFDLTFDFSVSSYVIPLAKGACIYTIPNKAVKFTYIASLLEDYHLTVLQMVPSMIRNLLPYIDEVDVSSVRYNILCGEALTGKVIIPWHEANPKMVSYNMYGPTEDTVFCTYYPIDKTNIENLLAANDIVSIGKTFKNSGILLVDDNDAEITSPNKEGELCLCGNQLTPGYWKNDKENAEKFFFKNGVRYYRSGDMCYFAEDGNLMYVSRKDFQVKINGYRVELGEIENVYAEAANGKYCVVLPYLNPQGNTELAIVVEGKEYDYKEHQVYMSSKLTKYMMPSRWLFVKSMPLNQNGKVDRTEIRRIFNL